MGQKWRWEILCHRACVQYAVPEVHCVPLYVGKQVNSPMANLPTCVFQWQVLGQRGRCLSWEILCDLLADCMANKVSVLLISFSWPRLWLHPRETAVSLMIRLCSYWSCAFSFFLLLLVWSGWPNPSLWSLIEKGLWDVRAQVCSWMAAEHSYFLHFWHKNFWVFPCFWIDQSYDFFSCRAYWEKTSV